ncbi:MAG: RNA polymerase sigma factor [Acidimicrobiales bacterium]
MGARTVLVSDDADDDGRRPAPEPGPDIELEPEPVGADLLAELYARHVPGALRFAGTICASRAEAEDVVQEAFVRAAARFGALRSPDAFGAYLRRAVVNVAHSSARSAARDHRRSERHALLTEQDRPPAASGPEGDDSLWEALQTLPDRQRVAVVCRYWLDLPERETAKVLGCRPGTVKSLLSRALDSLREVVTDG